MDWRTHPTLQAGKYSRFGQRLASAAAMGLAALLACSFAATALSVTITSPTDGSWTSQTSVTVTGTAVAPGVDTAVLSSDAELAGGFETNTTVAGGKVVQTFPAAETYRYAQDFSGMAGQDHVDDHWTWNFSGTAWQVSPSGSFSPSPPTLARGGNGGNESITWMAALPGNATEGWVAFDYFCEASAFLDVFASKTGHTSSETNILATGQAAFSSTWYNVSTLVSGSDTVVVRFQVSTSSGAGPYCAIDNFVAQINFTRALTHTMTVSDDFSNGQSWLWSAPQAGWDVTNASSSSASPPAYGHRGMAPTSARLNLAFPDGLTGATVAFVYQCEANASVNAYISPDGGTETTILAGVRGAPLTSFLFDVTTVLSGSAGLYLRLDSSSTSATGDLCAIDDLSIQVTYRGHMALTYDGSYDSPIVDLGILANLESVGWWGLALANTTVDVFARSSPNNLSFSDWNPVPPGSASPPAASGRYVQFRANFTSVGGFQTGEVDAFMANFSAIVSVEWSTNQVSWFLASGTTNWSATVPLGAGTNTITVRVRDTTGTIVTSQVQVSRDNIPPGPAGKPQAPAVTNGSSVTWTWTPATDVGVGVSYYLVDVGLSLGGTELATEVVVNGTNFTYSPVPDGGTVFLSVRSVDGGGIRGLDRVTSNGTVVDRTAPSAVTVQGPPEYSNSGSLTWSWARPSDPGTGVSSYLVEVGTTSGADDVFTGTVTGTSYTLLGPESGKVYFATVTAVDGAGNAGPRSTSQGTTSDRDAPVGPGAVTTANALTNASTVTWQWQAATDPISGVDHYRVQVGTQPGARDLADINTTELSYTLGFVESGTFVYLGVTPVDVAGNVGTRVDALVVHSDSTAPGNTTLSRVDPYVKNATVVLTWTEVVDGPAPGSSGVAHYVVRVRSGTQVSDETVTDTTYAVSVADGVTYTVEVFAVDQAQNSGPVVSVTFTGDQTGPAAPGVVTARVTNPLGPSFTASWNATVDAGSGLLDYRVNVGTSPGGTDIASGVRVTRLNYTWTGTEGTEYYVTVWAVDKLGNVGPSVSTAGPVSYTEAGGGGGFLPGIDALAAVLALGVVAGTLVVGRRRAAEGTRRHR